MTTCNVLTAEPPLDFVTLLEGGFSQYNEDQLKVIKFGELEEDVVRLSPGTFPNSITALWFLEKERLGDGFQASFSASFDGKYFV